VDTLHTQRNRRSPRVPNQPWRGPAGLTIPQTGALLAAALFAVALWWASGYLPGSASFGVLAGRVIGTGFAGGIAAVLCYAAADPTREPVVRQHLTYSFRRHTYRTSKESAHGTYPDADPIPAPAPADPLPFAPRRPRVPGRVGRPAPAPATTAHAGARAGARAGAETGVGHLPLHAARRVGGRARGARLALPGRRAGRGA